MRPMETHAVVVVWRSADGEEHEERWSTVEAFRLWAMAEGIRASFTAYEADEDGDLVIIAKGEV